MINRKNYFILAGVLALFVAAYFGILSLFGFAELWNLWRKISFCLVTYVLALLPLIGLLYFYQRTAK